MITGPKRVLGVPATQGQSRDRRRRRRRQQENPLSDSDGEKRRSTQQDAVTVKTRQRPNLARPDAAEEASRKNGPQSRHGRSPRQRRQVDIRV